MKRPVPRRGQLYDSLAAYIMDAFAEAKALRPAAQWLDVRYEDLVANPREHVGRMLAFLELDWSPAFQKGFARYEFHVDREAAYRDELTPAQMAAVERAINKPLREWGYGA